MDNEAQYTIEEFTIEDLHNMTVGFTSKCASILDGDNRCTLSEDAFNNYKHLKQELWHIINRHFSAYRDDRGMCISLIKKPELKKMPIIEAPSITAIGKVCDKFKIKYYYGLLIPYIKEDVQTLYDKLEGEYSVYIYGCDEPLIVPDIKYHLKTALYHI